MEFGNIEVRRKQGLQAAIRKDAEIKTLSCGCKDKIKNAPAKSGSGQ
jgi:hypothetical protein